MSRKLIQLGFFLSLIFTSCAKDIIVSYQAVSDNTGTIFIKPTRPTSGTLVTLNDQLIVNGEDVKSVTVNNVPRGTHKLNYVANSANYKYSLNFQTECKVDPNKQTAVPVDSPPYSTLYYVTEIFSTAGAIVVLALIL